MPNDILVSSRNLKWRYRITLFLSGGILLLTILVSFVFALHAEKINLYTEMLARGQQIQGALNKKVDLAQGHIVGMRRTVEKHLQYPNLSSDKTYAYLKKNARLAPSEAPWETLPETLQNEVGSLQINPSMKVSEKIFQRDISAVLAMLPAVVSKHKYRSIFQWSYYYDANKAWFLLFPRISRAEFLTVTGKNNMSSAIDFYFDADGTLPVVSVGPNKNPSRSHIWTPPYTDAGGKGRMVSLLAPVYLGEEYVGAVGTDVTLSILDSTFREIPPLLGRAIVVDNNHILLAESHNILIESKENVKLNMIIPSLTVDALQKMDEGKIIELENNLFITYSLTGTTWKLLIQVPQEEINMRLIGILRPFLLLAFGLFFSLFLLAWIQNRRFTQPALSLAEFVDRVSTNPNSEFPKVPRVWRHWFERVAKTAIERQNYLDVILKHASELENKVAERTIQLKEANTELKQTLTEVQTLKLQQDGDYYLMSLLIRPLVEIQYESSKVKLDFFIRQKKKFVFRNDLMDIGGDSNVCHSIKLGGKNFLIFINADSMGKSLQGAGGVLVFASVFKSIIERTKTENKTTNPKKWLLNLFLEIHKVFESFQGTMLISGIFCLLEEETGLLYYILSDHPPIVLYKDRKAKFLETNYTYPKLGLWILNNVKVKVETYRLKIGDCLILGSDGRDDISLGKDANNYPIINQDGNTFLRHVENAQGELPGIYKEILKMGEQYDDISMIRMERI